MIGPGEDLESLCAKQDHLGVLRYIRAHELRKPTLVVAHGQSLLGGPKLAKSMGGGGGDASSYTAVLEQICLAACDVDDLDLAQVALAQLATKVSKDSVRFQRLQARCLEASGDYNGAMIMYEEQLQANPANVVALQRKYCVMRAQGTEPKEKVMAALNDYLGQQLADVSAWYEMAQMKRSVADFKGAAYALEQVVLGDPLDSNLHRELAEVYATLGGLENTALARKHMAQALELDPKNIRAQFGLVSVANQFLEESAGASKKQVDQHEQLVAKELVKYGAAQVLRQYKGTKMFLSVKQVMEDYTNNIDG